MASRLAALILAATLLAGVVLLAGPRQLGTTLSTVLPTIEAMSLTLGAALTAADNSFIRVVGTIDKTSGASKALAGVVSDLSRGLDAMAKDPEKLRGVTDYVTRSIQEAKDMVARSVVADVAASFLSF